MQMYPDSFHHHRLNDPFRQAERRVFQALAHSRAPGFAYYEWQRKRRDPRALQLDFALWLEGIGRFGLQVKGGHYLLKEGAWYRKRGRRGDYAKVIGCPLAVTSDATMSLLNEVAEGLGNSNFFIPILIFPDMEPDEAISKRSERSNVHLVWGTDLLLDRLAGIARAAGVRRPPDARDIQTEVAVITDGQVNYCGQQDIGSATDAVGDPLAPATVSTEPDLVIPHLRRVQVCLAPGRGNATSNREVRNM